MTYQCPVPQPVLVCLQKPGVKKINLGYLPISSSGAAITKKRLKKNMKEYYVILHYITDVQQMMLLTNCFVILLFFGNGYFRKGWKASFAKNCFFLRWRVS